MDLEALEGRRMLAFGGLPVQLGGSRVDLGHRVEATPDGGFIAAGLFSGTVDFDPSAGVSNLTSLADTDIYIAKYDSAGALVWARQIGGSAKQGRIFDQDRILDIAANPARVGEQFINSVSPYPRNAGEYVSDVVVDTDGSVVVTGNFIGRVDFAVSGGTQSFRTFDNEFYDAFVTRFDSAGTMVWARQFGDRFTDVANAATIDPSGNILVTGLFSRDVQFERGNRSFTLSARGRQDAYVMKLTSGGTVLWLSQWGSEAVNQPVREAGFDVTTDAAGNVFVAGTFAGTSDFDPSRGVFNVRARDLTDGVLVKYSPAGRLRAVLPYGGNRYDALTHVAVDSNNDVIVAGYFQGQRFDVDPSAATLNLSATPREAGDDPTFLDVFVQKLSRGGIAWVQQVRGDRNEFITDLKLDPSNNIIISGAWYGSATFGSGGPTLDSVRGPDRFRDRNDRDRGESYDVFLWKVSTSGANDFINQIGAQQDDFGTGVAVGSDHSILLTGRFRSTVDFDPGAGTRLLTALGLADAFLVAFDQLGNVQV